LTDFRKYDFFLRVS